MKATLTKHQIEEIKNELEQVITQTGPMVDVRMAMMVLQKLNKLLKTGGFPEFDVSDVRYTDSTTSAHLNAIQSQIVKVINVANESIDEHVENFNLMLDKFAEAVNDSTTLLEETTASINSIENQVIERVTNPSIYTHEVKVMNFNFNFLQRNVNILNDTIMTLPILSKKKVTGIRTMKVVNPNDVRITKLATPDPAKVVLITQSTVDALKINNEEINRINRESQKNDVAIKRANELIWKLAAFKLKKRKAGQRSEYYSSWVENREKEIARQEKEIFRVQRNIISRRRFLDVLKVLTDTRAKIIEATPVAGIEELKDPDLFRGSFIGRLIAPFDDIRWGDAYGLKNAFDDSANTDFVMQTIGWESPARMDIMINMSTLSNVNMITIDTNSKALIDFHDKDHTVTALPYEGLLVGDRKADALTFRIINDNVTHPVYHVLELKEPESKERVRVLNFAESLEVIHKAEDIFGPSQFSVEVGSHDTGLLRRNDIPVVETIVDNITMYDVIFGSSGQWTSDRITTEEPIVSIEIKADVSVPDTDRELVKFSISFDNEKFYDVRNSTGATDDYNVRYPTRIVLNNENLVDEYLYLPDQQGLKHLFLKVDLRAADTHKDTPVIYKLELKIKTEQEAQ